MKKLRERIKTTNAKGDGESSTIIPKEGSALVKKNVHDSKNKNVIQWCG